METEPESADVDDVRAEMARVQAKALALANTAAVGWLDICLGFVLSGVALIYLTMRSDTSSSTYQSALVLVFCFNPLYNGATNRGGAQPLTSHSLTRRWLNRSGIGLIFVVLIWQLFGGGPPWPVSALAVGTVFSLLLATGMRQLLRAPDRVRVWSAQPFDTATRVSGALIAVAMGTSVVTGNLAEQGLQVASLLQLVVTFAALACLATATLPWGATHVGAMWRGIDWLAFTTGALVTLAAAVLDNLSGPMGAAPTAVLAVAATAPLILTSLRRHANV